MAGNENSKLKLLYLMDIFTKKTDEEHPMNAVELCSELEKRGVSAERKSIYKDIQVLRDFGMDIVNSPSSKKGFFLGQRDFEPAELRLLEDAVQAASFISHKKTKELVAKIEGLASNDIAKKLHSQVYVDARHKSLNESVYYVIETLSNAIVEQKQVKFFYIKRKIISSGTAKIEEKEFTVNPYALIWSDDHYYLVCNYDKYDNLMHLRIDRIKNPEMTDKSSRHFSEVSRYTNAFNSADYVNNLFNMYSGEPKPVEMKCKNEIIDCILDRFGINTKITYVDEGHFGVKINAVLNEGFIGWVMQYGDEIEILKPSELRKKVADCAASVLNMYTEK